MAEQGSDKKTRQKIVIGALIVIGGIFAWVMFGGSSTTETAPTATTSTVATPAPATMPTPRPAELPKPAPLTQREAELLQLQQETEARYLAAVNELQMLRIQRDIAETNKAIAGAKLDTVSAQKNIISLLTPEQTTNYGQHLVNPAGVTSPTQPSRPPVDVIEVTYTVISVTEIQGRWGAVVGAQGKLYNVHVGDVLPIDNSKVININRSGIVLEKDGVKRTISLVPII